MVTFGTTGDVVGVGVITAKFAKPAARSQPPGGTIPGAQSPLETARRSVTIRLTTVGREAGWREHGRAKSPSRRALPAMEPVPARYLARNRT